MWSKRYELWKQYQYYALIAIISLFALCFLPMLGSAAGLAWALPTTTVGWIVYIVSKLLVALLNILIFYCFNQQGRVNVSKTPHYIEANEILLRVNYNKEADPRSPAQWNAQVYSKKGVTIFLTTMASAVALTQAVLTFDWVSMLTYLFTIVLGIIFGIIQMNAAETYWEEEYYRYAKKVEREAAQRLEMDKKASAKQTDDTADPAGGSDILEPSDSDGPDGTDNQP